METGHISCQGNEEDLPKSGFRSLDRVCTSNISFFKFSQVKLIVSMRYETFRILYGHVCLWLCLAILLVYWKQSITVGIRYSVISRCNKDRLQFTSTASKKKSLTAWRFLTWVPPFQGKIYYQRCNHKTTLSLPDLIIVCRISDFGQSVKKIGRSESLTCQTLFGQPDSDIWPTRKTSGSGAWLEAVGRGLRQWGVAWGSGAWLEAVGRGLRHA